MKSVFYVDGKKYNYNLEFENLKINNNRINSSLLEYLRYLNISIPHYCYSDGLSIAGNCRMCLIEIKNAPKPIVSCSVSAKSCLNNSEIFTNSPLVKKARENIMEFLLLNHPLDCPICDQGGECDLQDQSFVFGVTQKRFFNFKKIVTNKNIGPIIKTVMTRCIHCTRCVRFANEVAGVEDLGMFGRGMNSEIGTYVNKFFNSELSGNVIDLCPVGALTSKQYPFVNRSWELKTLNSIDYSDGFGLDIQVQLKNNKILKVLPGYNTESYTSNWISDKTRFSFDGMFSPNRIFHTSTLDGTTKTQIPLPWKTLFKELTCFLYFQDHLNRHLLKIDYLIILFNNNINLESINLLILLAKRFSFLKLRKSENIDFNNDLESNFMLNVSTQKINLSKSSLCLLTGINTRYESSPLNLRLRQRYLKGNFEILSFSSLVDLTFPKTYIGSDVKTLKSITEGNNIFCQKLATTTNPVLILNSEIFKRNDTVGFLKLITTLKNLTKISGKFWDGVNVLNPSLNDAGLHYITNVKSINKKDIANSVGLYLINTIFTQSKLKKLVELKILNYLKEENTNFKILIEQNNIINGQFYEKVKKDYKIYNLINFSNNVFYETSGTYINSEGLLKKTIKIVSSNKKSKDDWKIIRKVFSYSKSIIFSSNQNSNSYINFNNNNNFTYKNFIGFNYYPIKNLTESSISYNKKPSKFIELKSKFKLKKKKILNTFIRFWLNDFYVGGKDFYSKHSSTMITCSKTFRLAKTNFY